MLVRVHAAALNPYDWQPASMAGGGALRAIRDVELNRSLGVAHVIDYSKADSTDGRTRYDVVHDNVGNRPLSRLRRALTPTGTLVSNAGGSPGGGFSGPIGGILRVLALNAFVTQQLRPLPDTWTRGHLLAVTELVEAGELTPVVGLTCPLADTAAGTGKQRVDLPDWITESPDDRAGQSCRCRHSDLD